MCTASTWAQKYIVGVQSFDYFPHYSFSAAGDKGYAWALLENFAAAHDIEFEYQILPTKRLQLELIKGTLDFVYPDNPRWIHPDIEHQKKAFSQGLTIGIAGTMVRKENQNMKVQELKSLAYPLGFIPAKWHPIFEKQPIEVVTTFNALAALQAVLKGRADAADIEYNVSKHLLSLMGRQGELVLAPQLPYSEVAFSVSSIRYPEMIAALDQFVRENPNILLALAKRYDILTPQDSRKPRIKDSN